LKIEGSSPCSGEFYRFGKKKNLIVEHETSLLRGRRSIWSINIPNDCSQNRRKILKPERLRLRASYAIQNSLREAIENHV
jgi:hypothetical protein